jgi:hypothetical protein
VLPQRQLRRMPPRMRMTPIDWSKLDIGLQNALSTLQVVRHVVREVRWIEGEELRESECWCRPFNVLDARMPLQVSFEDSKCQLHESIGVTDLYIELGPNLFNVPINQREISELVRTNLEYEALVVEDVTLHSYTAAAVGCYISALRANGFKSNGTAEVLKRGEQFISAMTRHQVEMSQHLSGRKATPRVT